MSKQRRTYTREFKMEAVRLWKTTHKTTAEVEQDLDITHGLLCKWKQRLADEGDQAFPGQGQLTPGQEHLRPLERENEILRQGRDIPKKAVAIFSHPSR